MANTDNQCKDLDVRDYFTENGYEHSKNSLEDLYSLQAQTQEMYFKSNAAWKPWKSTNAEIRQKRLSDLSEGDLKELKMEWIDVMHFVFNAGLAIGVTPKEFYNYYLSKNEENWNRQKNNY